MASHQQAMWAMLDEILKHAPHLKFTHDFINSADDADIIALYKKYVIKESPQTKSTTMSDDKNRPLPKQELLIKLLQRTAPDSNGNFDETATLIAMRKANELLAQNGWDWEKLINGRITVVADPFASIPEATNTGFGGRAPNVPDRPQSPSAPPFTRKPQAATPPRPTVRTHTPPGQPAADPANWGMGARPQPKPAPKPAAPPTIGSSRKNQYGNNCYCCGFAVGSDMGFIFKPSDFIPTANGKWEVVCVDCNNDPNLVVKSTRAPRQKTSVNDLI